MCFQLYEGKGYSEDFTDHMGRVIRQLEKEPETDVKLTVATDVVCANCPNNEGGSCNSLDKVKRYDEEVLKACDLAEGEEIFFAKFTQFVRSEIIEKGLRSSICGDCSWDYICSSKDKEI